VNKNICIHGHFYQPPRENPWLEEIELQESAYPYHDWNSKITSQCYAPNAASRILDNKRHIIDIVNNYTKISFNFGPTLLSWLQKQEPETYEAICEADKKSQKIFSGHGAAIAQAYNHMIMPLANTRDKRTQVQWGIYDFETRFNRKPEGMWLPETAVDMETLDILAEHGMRFTILAPHQVRRVRKIGDSRWKNITGAKIDPKMPYRCKLKSGKQINIFFYDGPVSQQAAFSNLLENGENFASRLTSLFDKNKGGNQLVHIATDGETYGHHHLYGDMALAYCIYHIESKKIAKITIYGQHLEKFPPAHEVEIFEESSWSCHHGIERWRSDCGCKIGARPNWSQEWRAPLRQAMDQLRDNLSEIFEKQLSGLLKDSWGARDDYISVVLDRSKESVEKFLLEHQAKDLNSSEKIKVVKLLESQRHAMLMYTSCGWFFDEISGIETLQIMQYAARAMQLAKQVSGISLEENYIKTLERAPSNIGLYKNGAYVYDMFIKPTVIDMVRVGVHYGVASVFKDYPKAQTINTYTVKKKSYDRMISGKQTLAMGSISVSSNITLEESDICFVVLHSGGHNLIIAARELKEKEEFSEVFNKIKRTFAKGGTSELMKIIEKSFSEHKYTLRHLFKDEQERILNAIFKETSKKIEAKFRKMYEDNYPLIKAVESFDKTPPRYLTLVLEFILNTEIRKVLDKDIKDFIVLEKLVDDIQKWGVRFDKSAISLAANHRLELFMEDWHKDKTSVGRLEKTAGLLKALEPLSLDLNLWKAQNIYFRTGKEVFSQMSQKEKVGDKNAIRWNTLFRDLGDYLKVKI